MITVYILGILGTFCYDNKHDEMDLYHCLTKPKAVYMGSTLGCDVRIEAVNVNVTKDQLNDMKKSGKFKIIYCK